MAVTGRLLARFLCHCTICQALYKAAFADVAVFWASAITLETPATVSYRRYRPPPALRRGTCRECGAPVAGFMGLAPHLCLGFVPARNLAAAAALPAPGAHIFYHRRIADCADALPKHSGYWRSELAAASLILRGAR